MLDHYTARLAILNLNHTETLAKFHTTITLSLRTVIVQSKDHIAIPFRVHLHYIRTHHPSELSFS